MTIGSDDLVGDVMNDWPATIRVFLGFKMGCVGCPMLPHRGRRLRRTSRRSRHLSEGAARSCRGTLRGLSFRNIDFRQNKLIYVKSIPAQPVFIEAQATKQAEVHTTEGLKP